MTMRVPPNSLDLERAILCAALLDADTLDVCECVKPETFYSESHAVLWREMHALRSRGMAIDHLNLRAHLESIGKLRAIGGDEFLFHLTNTIPLPDTEARARELCDLAQRRHVLSVCMEAVAKGYDMTTATPAFLEWVQATVFQAAVLQSERGGLVRMDPRPSVLRIQDVAKGAVNPRGYSTGLEALDADMNGLEPGCLYIVAGRPGMGKTSLALGADIAVSRLEDKCTAFFSLEMRKEQIIRRRLSIGAGIPGRAMRDATMTGQMWSRLVRAASDMDAAHAYIEDTPAMSIDAMRASLRRMVAKSGRQVGLITVDHLGLARSGRDRSSREQEVSEIARDLKVLAKEFDAPVIALCQLNRECEKTAEKRPAMHHLRDSGEIEQSADVVLLLYRRGYYAAEKKAGRYEETARVGAGAGIQPGDDDGQAEIIRGKVRDGEQGTTHVLWEGECTRFRDYGADDYRPDARVRGEE